MKIKKNKVVFMSVLATLLIFIIAYSVWVFGNTEKDQKKVPHIDLPTIDLKDFKEYNTRIEAIEELQEGRERTIPSVYNENLLDSLGYYDPGRAEKEKGRILDSIFKAPSYAPNIPKHRFESSLPIRRKNTSERKSSEISNEVIPDFRTPHEAFFKSSPESNAPSSFSTAPIPAFVDGKQVVQNHSRLRLRLQEDFKIDGKLIPRNTLIYGIVTLQPNRLLLKIENIGSETINLSVLDAEDYRKGMYVENNLRSEVQNEIGQTTLGAVNVPGVPTVSRVSNLFRRNIHREKVTLLNNYKVILQEN